MGSRWQCRLRAARCDVRRAGGQEEEKHKIQQCGGTSMGFPNQMKGVLVWPLEVWGSSTWRERRKLAPTPEHRHGDYCREERGPAF